MPPYIRAANQRYQVPGMTHRQYSLQLAAKLPPVWLTGSARRDCTIYLIDGVTLIWYSFNQPRSSPNGRDPRTGAALHSPLE
jgi:hypothetical protein